MKINPLAGKPVQPGMLVDVVKLVTVYYAETPDPAIPRAAGHVRHFRAWRDSLFAVFQWRSHSRDYAGNLPCGKR
jgi:hypothetical protein